VILLHPIAQALEDETAHDRVVATHRIAAAGKVLVKAAVWLEDVIGRVLQPTEGDRRPTIACLAGVVKDYIQNHLDAGAMQGPDHVAELVDCLARVSL